MLAGQRRGRLRVPTKALETPENMLLSGCRTGAGARTPGAAINDRGPIKGPLIPARTRLGRAPTADGTSTQSNIQEHYS